MLTELESPVLVQGITGREGRFHALQMIEQGTNIVAGVTPGKGGEWVSGIPVFDTVSAAVAATAAEISVGFVPAAQSIDAIYEAVDAGIKLQVIITEGIPILDSMRAIDYARSKNCRIIGPNCPGMLIPGAVKLGIIPANIARPGSVGVVSRSGTLTYEVINVLTQAGFGQSVCIGIGGDPVVGTTMIDVLSFLEDDPGTDRVALLGEIGGRGEIDAAQFIKTTMTKPVVAYVTGRHAPSGLRMGHAGAIIEGESGTAEAKIAALLAAGVRVSYNPEDIPALLR
jgi:succinyl-CoA synthetase alpha subunit